MAKQTTTKKGALRLRNGVWNYRITDDGKQIERAGTADKEETENIMIQVLAEAKRTGKIFKASSITVGDMADLWFTECCKETLRHGTRNDYKNLIENHIKPALGKRKLKDIVTDDLQYYVDDKSKKYAKSTMKSHFVVLNGMFKYAVYPKHYIETSPMLYVSKKKINKNLDTFLDIDDEGETEILDSASFEKLIAVVNNTIYYLPVMIAYHTGMRIGEVCALTWNSINTKDKYITVNKSMFYNSELKQWEFGKPKGGISRTIDFGDTLANIVKQARKVQHENRMFFGDQYIDNYYVRISVDGMDHTKLIEDQNENSTPIDLVCTKKDGAAFTNQTAKCGAKMIKKKTGLPFYFHMLRHTHATLLIENGANMKDVQERLGHTDIRITMNTYAHVTPKMRKQTVDIFERALK
ncbi:MAG: phage integrase family protein [Herbinix sp.]|jgi:integrase|nr:phage integrase family protein [Herbinix sp.]